MLKMFQIKSVDFNDVISILFYVIALKSSGTGAVSHIQWHFRM